MQTITQDMPLTTRKYILSYDDPLVAVAATTATITLETINPGGKLIGAAIHVLVQGTHGSTLAAELGDGTDVDEYIASCDLKGAAGTTYSPAAVAAGQGASALYASVDHDGASPVKLLITSGAGNLSTVTAGRWEVQLTFLNPLVPA